MAQAQVRVRGAMITSSVVQPALLDPRCLPGTLLLLDNTHPAATKTSDGSATGTLTNIAAEQTAALVGSAVPTAAFFSTTTAPGRAGVRFTAAGSVHLTASVTADALSEQAGISTPPAVWTYLRANTSHSYYLGLQYAITREPNVSPQYPLAGVAKATNWGTIGISAGRLPGGASGGYAGYPGSSDSRRVGLATDTRTNTQTVSGTTTGYTEYMSGITATDIAPIAGATGATYLAAVGPTSTAAWLHNTPSWVLRSLWLVDLTANGSLNHTGAFTIDARQHMIGVTGRWKGDVLGSPLA